MIKRKLLAASLALCMMLAMTGCSLPGQKESKNGSNDKIEIETEAGSESVNDSKKDSEVGSNTDSDSEEKQAFDVDILEDKDVSDKVEEINMYIDNFYYFGSDKESQEEAIYDGILDGLGDPYSCYYTAEEYAELQEENTGEYVGIGAVVTQDADMIVSIVRPIPGSPAEEAGLQAEDIIVEVDGVEITDQELTQVVEMIRGEEGTQAHVKIYRESVKDYLEFDVTRRVVENVTVNSEMLDNNIGYVQVQQFYENTPDEFIDAIEDCKSQGAKAFVIDLRDNPGGLLTAVVDMCDYIIEDGVIVSTKDKNGRDVGTYEADDEYSLDMPMIVLVNGNSASASEIFAGAMQDTGKAKLVGTTTFGKGIVQSVIPLSDGTAIKLTVAKYFTPNGNDIHGTGIEPDYVVELADGRTNAVNLEKADDLQLQKAEELLLEMMGN